MSRKAKIILDIECQNDEAWFRLDWDKLSKAEQKQERDCPGSGLACDYSGRMDRRCHDCPFCLSYREEVT